MSGLVSDHGEARAALEALLFVASEPVEIEVIASALEWPPADVEREIERLAEALKQERRGVMVQRHAGKVQLVSAPRFGALIERFLAVERKVRFSEAALETLAIIAYRQPITRAEIEAVRGVDCSGVLATLVAREMIEVTGRRATIGNPLLYGTTDAFLRQFGIEKLEQLPAEEDDQP
ncbi:MAG: SMC-Scp complex subunit ScpB [Geminicoccales bacterium]